jgi:hypothetical protein
VERGKGISVKRVEKLGVEINLCRRVEKAMD